MDFPPGMALTDKLKIQRVLNKFEIACKDEEPSLIMSIAMGLSMSMAIEALECTKEKYLAMVSESWDASMKAAEAAKKH